MRPPRHNGLRRPYTFSSEMRALGTNMVEAVIVCHVVSECRLFSGGVAYRGLQRLSAASLCNGDTLQCAVCATGPAHSATDSGDPGAVGTLLLPIQLGTACYRVRLGDF